MSEEITNLLDYYSRLRGGETPFGESERAVEVITALKYMADYCPEHAAAMGIGGNADANVDYKTVAAETERRNVILIRQKNGREQPFEEIYIGNLAELDKFGNGEFDVVLNIDGFFDGDEALTRELYADECMRVLKPGGTLFIAYQNKYGGFFKYNRQWQAGFSIFNEMHGKTENEPPKLDTTPDRLESFMDGIGAIKLKNVSVDGMRRMVRTPVSSLTKEDMERYLKLHFELCESDCLLGYSEYALYIGRKLAS